MGNNLMKDISAVLMSLTLILAGINALTRMLSWTQAWMDILIIPLAMASILLTFYNYNQYKFKTLMNLMFFTVFVGVVGLILAVQTMVLPTSPSFVVAIYQGFMPLLMGTVVAGVVIIGIGAVRLGDTLKGKKKR